MSSVEPNWPNDRDHLRMDGRVAPDLSSPAGVPDPSRWGGIVGGRHVSSDDTSRSDERIQQIEQRRLHEAEGLADLCSRAGAVCGRGLLAEVERLAAELRDARAENESLDALADRLASDCVDQEKRVVLTRREVERQRARVDHNAAAVNENAAMIDDLRAKLAAAERQLAAVREALLMGGQSAEIRCAMALGIIVSSEGGTGNG